MPYLFFALLGLCLGSVALGASAEATQKPELVVYVYDSLMSKKGLGPEIFPLFEKQCGCKVRALPSGDGGQLVSRLQLDAEQKRSGADVVLGLDQNTYARARPLLDGIEGLDGPEAELRPQSKSEAFSRIKKDLWVGPGFIPFDYGVFAFMADREGLKKLGLAEPRSLKDLLRPEWKRNVILEDPRTSTPGLAFVLYANQVQGDASSASFWKSFRTQWLTLSPGWDAAYSLFLKGEAPLVWSYTTSQAYHEESGDRSGRYHALIFEEGQPVQIEGASRVKGSRHKALAKQFLEFLVSPEVQSRIPLKNWMLPVVEGVKLPASFERLPKPKKLVRPSTKVTGDAAIERALAEWRRAIQ